MENKPDEPVQPVIDEVKILQYRERVKLEQNLPFGAMAGFAAALVGGSLWAVVTINTGYQIGWMAVGIGFIVGFSVRQMGKGVEKIFGIMGAALSLFGCLLGNFLSVVGFAANEGDVGFFELLGTIDLSLVPDVMISSFGIMDVVFYGLAVYEGYRFSFRQVTQQEIVNNMK